MDNKINYQLTEEELIVLEERWEEYKKNPELVRTWEEVKADILVSLKANEIK